MAVARHYLDHASTQPVRPEVVDAMVPWMAGAADPARVHTEGRIARAAVEDAREAVAGLLGARPREVVFTGGATEAINAAVWGATRRTAGVVLCAAVEHSAVREAAARSATVVDVVVDGLGRIHPDAVVEALDRAGVRSEATGTRGEPVSLVNCQSANHEVGTVQPVAEVAEQAHRVGALVHVDAAAAAGHLPVDFAGVGADLMSVSAHKFGGPQGIGALVVRRGLRLDPFIVGGEQERARRAGLENVPAIVGFGAAARLLMDGSRLESEADDARRLTGRVLEAVPAIGGASIYGDPAGRAPHIVCLGIGGVEAEAVVLGLDQAGVAVHSGSACSSESLEPSPVLEAMGVDADRSVRVSVGWSSTDADIDALLRALPEVERRLRALGGASGG